MTIFPTRYSTLSAAALGVFIEEQYGISAVQCRYKLRGVSDTYHVQSGAGEYILKIFRPMHRSREELLGEIALLEYLLRNDIQVAAPIKDLTGNTLQSFQAIEGLRHGILYRFAQFGLHLKSTIIRKVIPGYNLWLLNFFNACKN